MVSVVQMARAKQCTCSNCKAILEYNYGDMSFSFERDYTGDGEKVARINCPVCGNKQAVSTRF